MLESALKGSEEANQLIMSEMDRQVEMSVLNRRLRKVELRVAHISSPRYA